MTTIPPSYKQLFLEQAYENQEHYDLDSRNNSKRFLPHENFIEGDISADIEERASTKVMNSRKSIPPLHNNNRVNLYKS
jgi:hypothetical protein